MKEVAWAGIRVVVPAGSLDRRGYLRTITTPFTVYHFTTPCGRNVAFALEDVPETDLRCWCGEEFLVQWISEGKP